MDKRLRLATLLPTQWPAVYFRVFLAALLIISIGVGAAVAQKLFRANVAVQYNTIANAGQLLAKNFDHELLIQSFSIETLEAATEELLHRPIRLYDDPIDLLRPMPGKPGYTLVEKPSAERQSASGNISGLGDIPAHDTPLAREIAAALALTPIFWAIQAHSLDPPWIYYLSSRDFIYLFPRVPPEEFFYTSEIKQQPVYRQATPEANPQRHVFWTSVHTTYDGKNKAISVCKPLYHEDHTLNDDEFMGSLCIDVPLKTLTHLLGNHQIPYMSVHLLDESGQTMIHAGRDHLDVSQLALTPHQPTRVGEQVITLLPLESKNWQIALDIPYATVRKNALEQSIVYGVVVFFIGFLLVLLLVLGRVLSTVHQTSLRDSLTGTFNRRHFDATTNQEFARIRRCSGTLGLALLDVDYFKRYNDRYGHQAGDEVLRKVADAVSHRLQRTSDRLFRVGGEEFAILVHCDTEYQLSALLDIINAAVRDLNIEHADSPFGRITLSAGGVLACSEASSTEETTYRRADEALYEAKEKGRDQNIVRAMLPPDAPPPRQTG